MSGDLPEEILDVERDDIFGDDEDETEEEVEPEEREQVMLFDLGGRTYATPVLDVTQVVEPTALTRVPRTAEAVDGIMDMRGEIVAILNPWVHLTAPGEPQPWEEQLVAVFTGRQDEQPIGIRIDDVLGVEQFRESLITYDVGRDDEGPDAANPVVSGMIAREEDDEVTERIPLLDTDAIIDGSGAHPHLREADLSADPAGR